MFRVVVCSDEIGGRVGAVLHTLLGSVVSPFTMNDRDFMHPISPLSNIFNETYADYLYPVTEQYVERTRIAYHGDIADPLYRQTTLGRISRISGVRSMECYLLTSSWYRRGFCEGAAMLMQGN